MSRFFDLLHRLSQGTDDSSLHSNGQGPENRARKASDLDEALSVLSPLATGGRETIESPPTSWGNGEPNANPDELLELQSIPMEDVAVHPGNRIVVQSNPKGAGSDRFRLLRIRLRELRKAKKEVRTLLITSPLPEEGKSTVALNLATALADGGKCPVLLIEADLHRFPLIHQLGLKAGSGLAECLETGLNPLTTIRHLNPLGWYLLPAGRAQGNPTELLQGDVFAVILQRLSRYFDWVLIDSPPITPLSDAVSLSRHANASVLVVRAGRTSKQDIERAIGLLGKQSLLGILLNGVEGLNGLYSRYSTYYGNGQAHTSVTAER